MNDPINVLLVDDHTVVRMGLTAYFNSLTDINIVGSAASGREAVIIAEIQAPDIVLMDLVMPGMDGIETTRQIKRISPRSQVIVLTSHHDDEHIFPAIQAGALSYLLKDIDPDDLADAIRRAHSGEATLHPRVAARLVKEISGSRMAETPLFSELTDREMEVLRLIAEGKNNREISESLVISEKTVKSHVSNILSKLHLADRTQAAVYAWREGIVNRENTS